MTGAVRGDCVAARVVVGGGGVVVGAGVGRVVVVVVVVVVAGLRLGKPKMESKSSKRSGVLRAGVERPSVCGPNQFHCCRCGSVEAGPLCVRIPGIQSDR